MGNIGTKTEECTIYVQTKEPFYEPHQLVEGSVYVEAYQVVSASHIELIIKGQEKVKFEENKGEAGAAPAGDKIAGKVTEKSKVFEPHTVKLASIDGNLATGQYQFPFSFQLPEFIPGSFSLKDSVGRFEGSIKYTLKAVLVKNGGPGIKHKAEIVVREKALKPNFGSSARSEQALCAFCLPKGNCRIECAPENDFYQPGDEAHIICKIDNSNGKVPLKTLQLSLIQHVTLRSKKKNLETKIKRKAAEMEYDGIEAGEDISAHPKILDFVLSEIEINMVSGKDRMSKMVQPSAHGTLVECKYEMEIAAVFNGSLMCCSNFPVAVLPLHISARPSTSWASQMPAGFKPEVSEPLQLILPAPSTMGIGAAIPIAPGMHIGMYASGNLSPEQALKMSVGPTVVRAEVAYSPMSPPIEMSGSLPPTGTYAPIEVKAAIPAMEVKVDAFEANIGSHADKFEMRVEESVVVGPTITHEEVKVKAPAMEANAQTQDSSITVPATSFYVKSPEVKVEVKPPMEVNANAGGPSESIEMNVPGVEAKADLGLPVSVSAEKHADSEKKEGDLANPESAGALAPKPDGPEEPKESKEAKGAEEAKEAIEVVKMEVKVEGAEGVSMEVKAGVDNPALSMEAHIEAPKEDKQ